jgi:8-oxo-dGTP diphosphatase
MPSFGPFDPSLQYRERRAAYVVILAESGAVAAVRGREKFFLPGGGTEAGETAESTIHRELQEELARRVCLLANLGQATQYFYARQEDQHYRMEAEFFLAEFASEPEGVGEHQLHWIPLVEVEAAFYHLCQVWAIQQAVRLFPRPA